MQHDNPISEMLGSLANHNNYARESWILRSFYYTGCPSKSGTLDFRYFDIRKYSIFWFHQIKHCLLKKKNDTKIIWFGSVVLILQPFLETQSITNLRELFRAGMAVHKFSLCFVRTDLLGVRATMYGSQKSHYPCLKMSREWRENWQWSCLRNYHRIKTTQPISMILVSFFSEDNVLSDGKKKKAIFLNIKVTKIERSAFLGHPV